MKKSVLLTIAILSALFGTSCNDSVRQLDVYREKGVVDTTVNVRFFKDSPNVPYISVKDFYKEFFKTNLNKLHNYRTGYEYLYYTKANEYISISVSNQTLSTNGIVSFGDHPDFKTRTGKLFIEYENAISTPRETSTYNLKDYSIKVYEKFGELYAPLTLLSDLSGGLSGYDIVYNGKDIYVFDSMGLLGNETDAKYFGAQFVDPLNNTNEERPSDLINFNYNELCFVFDKLRGYTKQLQFGDSKLQSLGLNKLLEQEHPKIKEFLLSKNKLDYYEGLYALFMGLSDGGHTGLIYGFDKLTQAINRNSDPDFTSLIEENNEKNLDYVGIRSSFQTSRKTVFDIPMTSDKYYIFNDEYKTAYIGFDKFNLDITGWDNYYNGVGSIPVDTDTYAFVRDKMYQAKSEGAENVVLDLTTNSGGSSYSLEGILGLFNEAKGYLSTQDVVGGYTVQENHNIDINLDGEFNETDAQEAKKFNFNVGVLVSNNAFSCGNLFPFNMKELGYKIIGEKTGGGACAVSVDSTADGIPYVHSSYLCLTDKTGENIDGGVDVDLAIAKMQLSAHLYKCDSYFDTASLTDYLSKAYK